MEDLIFMGWIAIVLLYAGLLIIIGAALFIVYMLAASILSGDFGSFFWILGGIIGVVALYGGAGFLLHRKGII